MQMGQQSGGRPVFGKVQGVQPRGYARTHSRAASSGPIATEFKPSQIHNYAEIVGNAFQTDAHPEGYGSVSGYVKPVTVLRFVSAFVDFILLSILSTILVVVTAANDGSPIGSGMPAFLLPTLLLMWFGYGIVMEASKYQGTVGKIVTGTVVVNEDGSAMSLAKVLGRNLGKILSGIVPFYIPYLMVSFTKKRQSLHDYMCGSYVYKKSDLAKLGGHVFD